LAHRYDALLAEFPVVAQRRDPDSYSGMHLYVIRLQLDRIKRTRREVFEALRALGIGVNVHYIPVHRQPYFERMGFKAGDFPQAESYYAEAISLPMFPTLSDRQQREVVAALAKAIES
jgi:dTDP-4-amino-4,6-dideoxygalactose transaminase